VTISFSKTVIHVVRTYRDIKSTPKDHFHPLRVNSEQTTNMNLTCVMKSYNMEGYNFGQL